MVRRCSHGARHRATVIRLPARWSFQSATPARLPPSAVSGSDPMVPTLLWLSRAVMLAMLLLGAGSSSFRTVATALPPRARSVALIAVAVGAIATIATVPLHGLDVLGRSLADLGASEAWGATMVSSLWRERTGRADCHVSGERRHYGSASRTGAGFRCRRLQRSASPLRSAVTPAPLIRDG
jgi:hypothetical protein